MNYLTVKTAQPIQVFMITVPLGSANAYTYTIECDTGLNWPQFVQAMTQALMSPNQDVLLK